MPIGNEQDKIRWLYNNKDIDYTLQVANKLLEVLSNQSPKLLKFLNFQMHELAPALVTVMKRGVRVDLEKKEELRKQLAELMVSVEKKLEWLIGEPFNPKSFPQVKALFKDLLKVDPVQSARGTDTFGSAAMVIYLEDYPLLRPLITLILEYRSIQVFVGTFLSAEVDEDGRMRCSYNAAGTSTYRLSSRKNAFGKGLNLQNIPSKGKMDLAMALTNLVDEEEQITISTGEGITELPNCKELFIPNEEYTFFDVDYSGADAMVVAWDSGCEWLMNFFSTQKMKLYIYIAQEYLQRELSTDDPLYKKYKAFVHLTNYGGGVAKAAATAGIPLGEAKKLQKFYFDLCPELPGWHKRVEEDIRKKGYIENIFGARGYFLDKNDHNLLNKAYAYIPQSSIGIMVNKGLVSIEKEAKQYAKKEGRNEQQSAIEVLMQVHDSLAGQYKTTDITAPERIIKHMSIELPYENPLIIPVDIATSTHSYGRC